MLEFRDIEITDRSWIIPILDASGFWGCEYSFVNNFAWKRLYDSKISRFGDFYICSQHFTDNLSFAFPAGTGSLPEVIEELKRYAQSRGFPLRITGVTENQVAVLQELCPGAFIFEESRGGYDYIYRSEDLVCLKGRKYHKKRNHLHAFEKYNYTFAPLTENDFDDCIRLSADFFNLRCGDSDSAAMEQLAIHNMFTHYGELELKGGILRVDGVAAAFTVASRLNAQVLDIHLEKADISFAGAYAAINQKFAACAAGDFEYINREEDLGLAGLRQSKMSYYPHLLLKKHTAVCIN